MAVEVGPGLLGRLARLPAACSRQHDCGHRSEHERAHRRALRRNQSANAPTVVLDPSKSSYVSHRPDRSTQAYNSHMSIPVGERRIVSVLIADIVGSTSIAETLGADRSKFLFDDIVRLMREAGRAVRRHGRATDRRRRPGALRAPRAHEDDAAAPSGPHRRSARHWSVRGEGGAGLRPRAHARVAVNTGRSSYPPVMRLLHEPVQRAR